MTTSLWLWPRRGTTVVEVYAGTSKSAEEILPQSESWQSVALTIPTGAEGVRLMLRLGTPEEPARPLDEVVLPRRPELPRCPYHIFDSVEAAAGLVQAVDQAVGLPVYTPEKTFRLSQAHVLRHPVRDLFAVPVTPELAATIRQGIISMTGQPYLLGPDWVGASPVPALDANVAADRNAHRETFGVATLLDAHGNPLSPGSNRVQVVQATLDDIAAQLNKDPESLFEMDPNRFEALVASLLERDGFRVEVTARSNDGGVDVYAVRSGSAGRFLFGVQCKRYKKGLKLKPAVVREMVGTLHLRGLSAGAVVTTALFSPGAERDAALPQANLSLVDYHQLWSWIHGSAPSGQEPTL